MSDQIRVNGNQYSWGSIVLRVDGEPFTGFTSISFGDKRERAYAYGMGRAQAPRGRTRGKYTPEPVKLTGFAGSVQILRQALAALSSTGRSYGNVESEITVQYVENEGGSNEVPIIVQLHRCTVTSDLSSEEESPDPSKCELEMQAMYVERNGYTLYDPNDDTVS
jgi:hypothetical protein